MSFSYSSGGVVVNNRCQVIIVNQRTSWSLPKGKVIKGEDKINTAIREIQEETGIKNVKYICHLGTYKRPSLSEKLQFKIIHMHLFYTDEYELRPTDKYNPEARWVEMHEVSGFLNHKEDKDFFESTIEIIKKYLTDSVTNLEKA